MKKRNRFCILIILLILVLIELNITTIISVKSTLAKHDRILTQMAFERVQERTSPKFIPAPTPQPKVENTKIEETPTSRSLGRFKLTAYCPCSICCGPNACGITSTGTKATAGRTIAVDPSKIPYGSEVTINGHTYIAEDCGGAIKGNRIDIFFNSHQEALQFGVQYADVSVTTN